VEREVQVRAVGRRAQGAGEGDADDHGDGQVHRRHLRRRNQVVYARKSEFDHTLATAACTYIGIAQEEHVLTLDFARRVYVGEIISEGSEREFLQTKPAPYNVVLEDGTYKGVLKLGLKFISSVSTRASLPVSLSRPCIDHRCDVRRAW
jgi:hypothetical protein